MSRNQDAEPVVQKTNLLPVIALLLLNLIGIGLCIGILMARTQSLVDSGVQGIRADRMGQIQLDQGNVVIDLMDMDNSDRRHKVTKQLVMRQEDFLAGYSAMEDFMRKLIEAGVVKPRAAETTQ